MICSRISENEKARLIVGRLQLISECTRSVPSCNCMGASVLSKFKNCSLTIWPGRLNNDVLRVLNSNNYPSSKNKLLPCFTKIDDVDT